MANSQRNILISFLQVFGIVLVVIGHSTFGAPTNPWFRALIYTFHMPLFIFISGYLLRYSCERRNSSLFAMSLKERVSFLWNKVKRLLLPYWFISSVVFVPKALMSRFALRPVGFSFDEYIRMLIYPWENVIRPYWFLPTLFVIFVLVIIFTSIKIGGGKTNLLIFSLFASLIINLFNPLEECRILNCGGAVEYLFYFVVGYSACRWSVFTHLGKHLWAGALVSFIVLTLLVFVVPDFRGRYVLGALVGITFCSYLSKIYEQRGWHFFHHLFGASYAIYLFSWFPQVVSQQFLLGLTQVPWQVASVIAFVTGIYVPLLLYKWIMKHKNGRIGKYVALLTGQ